MLASFYPNQVLIMIIRQVTGDGLVKRDDLLTLEKILGDPGYMLQRTAILYRKEELGDEEADSKRQELK